MELLEDRSTSLYISSVTADNILINNTRYDHDLMIIKDGIKTKTSSLSEEQLLDYLKINNITFLIVGNSRNISFRYTLMKLANKNNIAVEFMNLKSACNTHNILIGEREDIAILIVP